MHKLVLCLVALLAVLGHTAAIRTQVIAKRPIPVILAELEQISEESSYGPPPASSASQSSSSPGSESSTEISSATPSDMRSGIESSSGGSEMSATPAGGGSSESSSMGSSSGTRSFSSSSMAPPPALGPDPLQSAVNPTSASVSSHSLQLPSHSQMGSSFGSAHAPRHHPHRPRGPRPKRLQETDVFGEAPHTELANDEVDIIARMILKGARTARCAKEDEYCKIQFSACQDEQCRRQVEDQASLNPHERREIRRLLKN